MNHGNDGKKPTKSKRKMVPIAKRRTVGDCEPGDVVRVTNGRTLTVTAWFNGGPAGRWHDDDGAEGELIPLDAGEPIIRIRGLR